MGLRGEETKKEGGEWEKKRGMCAWKRGDGVQRDAEAVLENGQAADVTV